MPLRSDPVKVFLAEESEMICERLTRLLTASGMSIVGRARTPQACVEGILATQPDVVVLDVQLVGGAGLQVLRAVRSAAPRIAFIVFTHHSAPAYRRRYLVEGALQFIDKSAEFDQLARAVGRAAARQVPQVATSGAPQRRARTDAKPDPLDTDQPRPASASAQ